MSSQTPEKGFYGWVERRYHVSSLIHFLRHKEVPLGAHSALWYYLGGTTLFFLTIQIASGFLLLVYYQPGESTSYESIRFITTKVPFGWLVRSAHCWSAHLMIISLVVHMFSTMIIKAYRPPRELTWVTGFVLFALALCFGFSGYLLPWNELAFFATSVGTDSVKSVPILGQWMLEVLRGGPDVTIQTLYRFFALHVAVLPMAIVAIVGLHLIFIQRQGMAPPLGHLKAVRSMRFFPDFAMRDLLLWLICLIGLTALVFLLPYGPGIPGMDWELGKKANPLAPAYPGIKPEWYFLWVYQLLKEFPPHVFRMEGPQAALLVVTVLLGVWALVPWLDRNAAKGRLSPAFTDLAVAALLFIGYLTLMAWDIGGHQTGNAQPDAQAVARTTGLLTIAVGVATTAARILINRHRWYVFSGAALVHVALHGLFGLPYLTAGVIAFWLMVAVLAALLIHSRLQARRAQLVQGGPP